MDPDPKGSGRTRAYILVSVIFKKKNDIFDNVNFDFFIKSVLSANKIFIQTKKLADRV